MPSCFAPGCKSGYRKDASAQRHFFGPPRDQSGFKRWELALHRKDKRLNAKSKVCDIHFEVEDIVKHYRHVVDGKEVLIPRGKWELAPGAIPRLFPTLPAYVSRPKCSAPKRKPPKERATPCVNSVVDLPAENAGDALQDQSATGSASTEEVSLTLCDLSTVTLPSEQWKFEYFDDDATGNKCGIFYTRRLVNGNLLVQKTVVIDEHLGCVVNGYNHTGYTNLHMKLSYNVKTGADVESILKRANELKICEGVSSGNSCGERIHQKRCSVLSPRQVCPPCLRLRRKMRQEKPPAKNVRAKKLKMRNLKRALLRAAASREKKKKEVLELKEKLENTSEECVEKYLGGLPPLQRLALMTAFRQIKAKGPCGMRYSAEWLLNCMLVRIASPKAYKLLSDLKMLPLPSMSRLLQILKGIPCKYGFNVVSLEAIQKQMHNKAQHLTLGTLILDEIKLKQMFDFNKSTYKVDGFVDYGGVTEEGTKQLADHALVFMFVPLFEGWVQPIASFATKGAAPGRVLAELVLEAVVQLHKYGATAVAVVSDGAGNNKSMWHQFGVSGGMVSTRHKIPHPCLPDGKYLHFICDVPHAIKCVRNHLLKHRYGQVCTFVCTREMNFLFFCAKKQILIFYRAFQAGEHQINFGHYKVLFDVEKEKHLKVVPKLKEAHVQPNNLQKMNVRLATQV